MILGRNVDQVQELRCMNRWRWIGQYESSLCEIECAQDWKVLVIARNVPGSLHQRSKAVYSIKTANRPNAWVSYPHLLRSTLPQQLVEQLLALTRLHLGPGLFSLNSPHVHVSPPHSPVPFVNHHGFPPPPPQIPLSHLSTCTHFPLSQQAPCASRCWWGYAIFLPHANLTQQVEGQLYTVLDVLICAVQVSDEGFARRRRGVEAGAEDLGGRRADLGVVARGEGQERRRLDRIFLARGRGVRNSAVGQLRVVDLRKTANVV